MCTEFLLSIYSVLELVRDRRFKFPLLFFNIDPPVVRQLATYVSTGGISTLSFAVRAVGRVCSETGISAKHISKFIMSAALA